MFEGANTFYHNYGQLSSRNATYMPNSVVEYVKTGTTSCDKYISSRFNGKKNLPHNKKVKIIRGAAFVAATAAVAAGVITFFKKGKAKGLTEGVSALFDKIKNVFKKPNKPA